MRSCRHRQRPNRPPAPRRPPARPDRAAAPARRGRRSGGSVLRRAYGIGKRRPRFTDDLRDQSPILLFRVPGVGRLTVAHPRARHGREARARRPGRCARRGRHPRHRSTYVGAMPAPPPAASCRDEAGRSKIRCSARRGRKLGASFQVRRERADRMLDPAQNHSSPTTTRRPLDCRKCCHRNRQLVEQIPAPLYDAWKW